MEQPLARRAPCHRIAALSLVSGRRMPVQLFSFPHGGCMAVSRRSFVGGIAAALGYVGVGADVDLFAQQGRGGRSAPEAGGRGPRQLVDLSKVAKINNNENPYGIPPVVRAAMEDPQAWEWANRYGAPAGGLNQALQETHGVKGENIILGCGSA